MGVASAATPARPRGPALGVGSGDQSTTLVFLPPAPLGPVIKTSTGPRHLAARLQPEHASQDTLGTRPGLATMAGDGATSKAPAPVRPFSYSSPN